LKKIQKEEDRYKLVIVAYKKKLVEYGAMKQLKDKQATKKGTLKKRKDKPQVELKEKEEPNKVAKRRGRPRKNG